MKTVFFFMYLMFQMYREDVTAEGLDLSNRQLHAWLDSEKETKVSPSPPVPTTSSGQKLFNGACLFWRNSPQWARASSSMRFLDHTQWRTTVGRTPLDEWLARRRDLYLTLHNTHNRQTSMHPVGFEPTISAGERPQTYALDRAATGTAI